MTIHGPSRRPPALPTSTDAFENADFAVNWALDCLEDFEVHDFLKSRRAGKDLTPWIDHAKAVRQDVADMV